MNTQTSGYLITAAVHRGACDNIIRQLSGAGISCGHIAAGRAISLFDKKSLLSSSAAIAEDPIEILSIIVTEKTEQTAVEMLISAGSISIPGRGSISSEPVSIIKAHELCMPSDSGTNVIGAAHLNEFTGICCIVQRGQGDTVARVALDTGVCVPAITFGIGTGVRDKLGLLRITIPAEKEVISVMASPHDADAVMNMMVDAGKLDQPGKGFIYTYPIKSGIVNSKIHRGMSKHAASIEQIINAIDEIRGDTSWRERTGGLEDEKNRRKYLSSLMGITLICNEGRGDELVKAAMNAGAAGATISRLKHFRPSDSPFAQISQAREMCSMIVGEGQIKAILSAIDLAGAFDNKTFGILYSRPVPKACTYLGK